LSSLNNKKKKKIIPTSPHNFVLTIQQTQTTLTIYFALRFSIFFFRSFQEPLQNLSTTDLDEPYDQIMKERS